MDWLSLDALGKVVIPAATFGLGVVVTLATKRIEKRRAELKEHITAIVKLANDWYNQIHELSVDARADWRSGDTRRAIYFYVHNRLILPQLVLHLEFLRKRKSEPNLTSAVDDFLALVTTFSAAERVQDDSFEGPGLDRSCKAIFADLSSDKDTQHTEVEQLLLRLDGKLQEVTRLSAHALATRG